MIKNKDDYFYAKWKLNLLKELIVNAYDLPKEIIEWMSDEIIKLMVNTKMYGRKILEDDNGKEIK